MRQCLDKIRLAIRRAPSNLKDRAFTIACNLLLPISTMCKVCNMLRGMAIGVGIGAAISIGVMFLLLPHRGVC